MEKLLRTTNGTDFPAHINLSVDINAGAKAARVRSFHVQWSAGYPNATVTNFTNAQLRSFLEKSLSALDSKLCLSAIVLICKGYPVT